VEIIEIFSKHTETKQTKIKLCHVLLKKLILFAEYHNKQLKSRFHGFHDFKISYYPDHHLERFSND